MAKLILQNTCGRIFLFICVALFFPQFNVQAAIWQSQAIIQPHDSSTPLLPYLNYYIDESQSMDIEEAASPSIQYQPLDLEKLPPTEGIMWLRFTISPLPDGVKPKTFLLDMGQSVPGIPVLYDPERNELSGVPEWRENTPGQRNILLLPEEGPQAITCYIRLDGLPGPWFSPMIRTPQNAASNWANLATTGAILALCVVMAVCFLRWASEKGQWRVWTALFVAAALAQSIIGMPAINEIYTVPGLCAVLLPGISLMLLPHVGRHLIQGASRSIDIQLFLLSLPGAALALAPLFPSWIWLNRWLDLWPLGTILFVPTALGAWIMGHYGAKRFLAGSLIPPLFTGVGLLGLDFGISPNLLASAPIWGVALSALLIAATRSPWNLIAASASNTNNEEKKDGSVIDLSHPLDDPNLRIVTGQESDNEDKAPLSDQPHEIGISETQENGIREQIDDLLRSAAALGNCSLAPAAREYAENMIASAHGIADILSGNQPPQAQALLSGSIVTFDLQTLLRKAHDSISAVAQDAGISFSWYMPPLMPRLYRGNAVRIETVLRLLLESAARASEGGTIRLSVRKSPESKDNVLFTISDTGKGSPPKERSSLAIAKAWELVGANGGFFDIQAGPHGAIIDLSLHLEQVKEGEVPQKSDKIILACEDSAKRHELAKILEDLPCRINEAASMQEVINSQNIDPSALLIAAGKLAQPAAADMAYKFKQLASNAGYAGCGILAITEDDSQWNMLKPSGFTHAMREPVNPDDLKETVLKLLEQFNAKTGNDKIMPEADKAVIKDNEEISLADLTITNGAADKSEDARNAAQQNFEGPEWLSVERETAVASNKDAAKVRQKKVENKTPDEARLVDNPYYNDGDWVGEPTPISRQEPEQVTEITDFIVGVERQDNAAGSQKLVEQNDDVKVQAAPQTVNAPVNKAPAGQRGDPVIIELINNLDGAIRTATTAFEAKDTEKVAEATAYIIKQCDSFGLRWLSRMAQCVERAARADDLSSLSDLLPELALAVERNRIALAQKR